MELSKRLLAVAGLVAEGASVVDIGTDHAYIPIYLAENGISSRILAMDINEGPLQKAREHIARYGLESVIQTRLSDGLEKLTPGEADTMIAAGMGGALTIRILEAFPEATASIQTFILQPQSEIHKVRAYLNVSGFCIVDEDMVEEDGKYYPMMKCVHGTEPALSEEELYFGRKLIEKRHPVLHAFLKREYALKTEILASLKRQDGDRVRQRAQQLQSEIERIQRVRSDIQ